MGHHPAHKLSAEALEEFKKIYQEEFMIDLTDDEAEIIAIPVLRLFQILVQGDNQDTDK